MPVPAYRWSEAGARRSNHLLEWTRLTKPQHAYVSWPVSLGLWIGGNRLGKSYATAFDVNHVARNTHPFVKRPPGPKRLLVASYSKKQMRPLQRKIWDLAPKDELDPRNAWDDGRGIVGAAGTLVYSRGSGAGSVVEFATFEAGSKAVAGDEYDSIWTDEPPTESMYGELKPRILSRIRFGAALKMNFTPTPDSPPLLWLREMVEKGIVPVLAGELSELNEENTWPVWSALRGMGDRAPMPFYTQAEIDAEVATWLSDELEMRLRGAWEPISRDRWCKNFSQANLATFTLRDVPEGAFVCVGIDHGMVPGKQAAVLIVVENRLGDRPRVWWVDECFAEGFSTPRQDAGRILEMLRRNGLNYHHVDDWVGDYPTGEHKRLVQKSNAELRRELALALRVSLDKTKFIVTPAKGAGSVRFGCRKINGLLGGRTDEGKPIAIVHQRMARFRQFLETFRGDSRDPTKDVGDAGRYPIERNVSANTFEQGPPVFMH